MVYPYSGIDPDNYQTFCNEITKCKEELFKRPQISKQHFYIGMAALHRMEVQEPEMTPIIQDIGVEIESKLEEQHRKSGLYIIKKYDTL